MRALLSLRFVAAVAGLFALLFIVQSITATEETTADPAVIDTVDTPVVRVINLVERLDRSTARFAVAPDGTAAVTATFTIDEQRSLTIVEGTPGVNDCSIVELAQGNCVIFADLLGDAVVWFSLQPVVDDDHVVLPEVVSKEPLGPVVRHGDDQWADIASWTLKAMMVAEELGITSQNADEMKGSENPEIRRLLGVEELQGVTTLGLSPDWAYNIITQVGNYGESFERHLGKSTKLGLSRGINALAKDGGLHYIPPVK